MLKNKGLKRKAHGAQFSVSICRAIELYCFDGAHKDANAVWLSFSDSRLFRKHKVVPPIHGCVLWASE